MKTNETQSASSLCPRRRAETIGKTRQRFVLLGLLGCLSMPVLAAKLNVDVYATDKDHRLLGQVTFADTRYGLLITPNLTTLPPGLHGFHLHQHPHCGDEGMAAGGHYDPRNTNSHQGPYGKGHLGDLPVLYVNDAGEATIPTLAPRLKTRNLPHLSLMIHAGSDNYTDTPPLGGGGARLGCGEITPQTDRAK